VERATRAAERAPAIERTGEGVAAGGEGCCFSSPFGRAESETGRVNPPITTRFLTTIRFFIPR
jgi:hypothetical protein